MATVGVKELTCSDQISGLAVRGPLKFRGKCPYRCYMLIACLLFNKNDEIK